MPPSRSSLILDHLKRWPWWAVAAAILGVLIGWHLLTDQSYSEILRFIANGLLITLVVTMTAFNASLLVGLVVSLGRVSTNLVIYHLATFYVEIVRGIPTLVLLLFIAFGLFPLMVEVVNGVGAQLVALGLTDLGARLSALRLRDIDNMARVIVALTIAYSAFLAEIFRAGIQSIERGQIEAGRALGMTGWQVMRYVVLRQAIRRVLPALGNDFIAMLKDSSLVSALGVLDMTRLSINYQATTFKTVQTYAVLAYLYLVMTLLLSLVVKWIERRMARERTHEQPRLP